MKLEHFWYGLTNGDGYIFKRSDKVVSMLNGKSLDFLKGLQPRDKPRYNWCEKEQLVTVSIVQSVKDKDGRKGTTNYTVFIPIKQYISLSNLNINLSFTVPDSNILEPLEVNM